MIRKRRLLTCFGIVLVGCTSDQAPDNKSQSQSSQMLPESIHVVFLTREGCANTPVLLANLKSVAESFGPPVDYVLVNQGTLPPTDVRIGYATPTILYGNRDLFGLPKPAAPFPAPT